MTSRFLKVVTIGFAFGLSSIVIGQNLESTLQDLVENNSVQYVSPLVTAFGTGLNSGTFNSAGTHKFLGFDISLNASMVIFPDDKQTNEFEFYIPQNVPFALDISGYGSYNFSFDGDLLYPGSRTSSTFVGSDPGNQISVDENYLESSLEDQLIAEGLDPTVAANLASTYKSTAASSLNIMTPKGFDLSFIPTVIPQITIGLPMDIDLSFRAAPEIENDDIGKISFIGYGAKFGLNRYIPMDVGILPRLSVGYYMNNLTVGDVLDVTSSVFNIQASKKVLFLTVYGGYGLESTTVDVEYDPIDSTFDKVKFSVDGKNENRIIVGARLKMLFFSLNADYNFGEYNTVNVGASFSFR